MEASNSIAVDHNLLYDSNTNYQGIFDEYLPNSNLTASVMMKKHGGTITKQNESKKKSEKKNLQCVICGARAFGYNFDRITCESCKAFFRRNALKNIAEMQCRFGGNCDIRIENRRHCTCCRIKKCFDAGMKKEWIRSEEEKHKKQTQIEKQKNLPQTQRHIKISIIRQPEYFHSPNKISSTDRTRLNNIIHCYDIYAGEPSITEYLAPQNALELRIHDFYNRKMPIIINFISYFKHLPEFQELNIDDQVLLIKQNIRILLPVHYALLKTPVHSQFRYTNVRTIGCINNINLHSIYQCLSNSMVPFVALDATAIKLLLISLLFTSNLLSTHMNVFEYKTLQYIKDIQSNYTELLWLYLIEKHGQRKTVNIFTKFITTFLRIQTTIEQIDLVIRSNDDIQYLDPLLKVVLHLT